MLQYILMLSGPLASVYTAKVEMTTKNSKRHINHKQSDRQVYFIIFAIVPETLMQDKTVNQ